MPEVWSLNWEPFCPYVTRQSTAKGAWTCHQEPQCWGHHACCMCWSAYVDLQGCDWLSLGQKLLFSVYRHLKWRFLVFQITSLLKLTEKSCPGCCDTSVWMCIWYMPCCRRHAFIYTPAQKREIKHKDEPNLQIFPQIYQYLIWVSSFQIGRFHVEIYSSCS